MLVKWALDGVWLGMPMKVETAGFLNNYDICNIEVAGYSQILD